MSDVDVIRAAIGEDLGEYDIQPALIALARLDAQATLDQEHLTRVVAKGAAVEAERDEARRIVDDVHWALSERDVPRAAGEDEPLWPEAHRVWLLGERAEAAEAQVRLLTEALSEIAESPEALNDRGCFARTALECREIALAALASPSRDSAEREESHG